MRENYHVGYAVTATALLITNAQLKADVTELMNAEFENEWKKERKEEAEKLEDRLFK